MTKDWWRASPTPDRDSWQLYAKYLFVLYAWTDVSSVLTPASMSTTTWHAASVEDIVTYYCCDRGSNLNLGVPLSNKRIVFLLSHVVTITHSFHTGWLYSTKCCQLRRPLQSGWAPPGSWGQPWPTGQGEERMGSGVHWHLSKFNGTSYTSCETRTSKNSQILVLIF